MEGAQQVIGVTSQPPKKQDVMLIPNIITVLTDDVGTGVTYIGEAEPGTSTASAKWRIQKLDESSADFNRKWAGRGKFDQVWDNRLTLTYE